MDNELGVSSDYLPMDPKRLLERLHTALNTRDLTNLLHCLQVDYEQITPAGPGMETTGLEAARSRWDGIFTKFPDFRADLVREAIEGNTIWTEWRWHSARDAGSGKPLDQAGVIIYGVEEGLLAWERSYMTAVVAAGE